MALCGGNPIKYIFCLILLFTVSTGIIIAYWIIGDVEIPTSAYVVKSQDGTEIFVQKQGFVEMHPIIYVHDYLLSSALWEFIWSNSTLAKYYQMVRFDLRGHGKSTKGDTSNYYNSTVWADDLGAVISSVVSHVSNPTVVCWGYGGCSVLLDYVKLKGTKSLGTLIFLNAAIRPEDITTLYEPIKTGLLSDSYIVNSLAQQSYAKLVLSADSLTQNLFTSSIIGSVASVSLEVREAIFQRNFTYVDQVESIDIQSYIQHTTDNVFVDAQASSFIQATLPTAFKTSVAEIKGTHMSPLVNAKTVDSFIYTSVHNDYKDITKYLSVWTILGIIAVVLWSGACLLFFF